MGCPKINDGLTAKQRYCRKHRDAYLRNRRRYYRRNREVLLAKDKKYRDAHCAQRAARWKRYYNEHRADIDAKNWKYRMNNKPRCRAWRRASYLRHRVTQIASQRIYDKAHIAERSRYGRTYRRRHHLAILMYCQLAKLAGIYDTPSGNPA